MKTCFKCNKPIDEEGKNEYVMIITKRKDKIIEFICFHFNCWQEHLNSAVLEEVKEKMNKCSSCGKNIRFWSSYIKGKDYYCEKCWQKREDKLESAREEEERDSEKKSRKRDDSIDESQKTL